MSETSPWLKDRPKAATARLSEQEFERFRATCDRVRVPAYLAAAEGVRLWCEAIEEAEALAAFEAETRRQAQLANTARLIASAS